MAYTCTNCFLQRLWQARSARMMGYERRTHEKGEATKYVFVPTGF